MSGSTKKPQVSKRVCLSTPFVKEATQKGSRKEHCMCIKENKTFHRKAFSATLQASTHLFDTCDYVRISAKDLIKAKKCKKGFWNKPRKFSKVLQFCMIIKPLLPVLRSTSGDWIPWWVFLPQFTTKRMCICQPNQNRIILSRSVRSRLDIYP